MWRRMMLRGMADRFDWGKQAREYIELYRKLPPVKKETRDPCPCEQPPQKAAENRPKKVQSRKEAKTTEQAENTEKAELLQKPDKPDKTKKLPAE
jgi:hypothetical protein